MKVGMDGAHFANFHLQPGLLGKLPAGGVPYVLAPLNIAAGYAPRSLVASGGTAAQQNTAGVVKRYDRYSHRRDCESERTGRLGNSAAATLPLTSVASLPPHLGQKL